jgi:hypothetical protein
MIFPEECLTLFAAESFGFDFKEQTTCQAGLRNHSSQSADLTSFSGRMRDMTILAQKLPGNKYRSPIHYPVNYA